MQAARQVPQGHEPVNGTDDHCPCGHKLSGQLHETKLLMGLKYLEVNGLERPRGQD